MRTIALLSVLSCLGCKLEFSASSSKPAPTADVVFASSGASVAAPPKTQCPACPVCECPRCPEPPRNNDSMEGRK